MPSRETAAPAARSFAKGSPQVFTEWKPSFVDGAGGQSVFPRMWERMKPVVDGCIVVSLDETKKAMRLMAEKARVISEGAGALTLAAALTGKSGQGPIVAIVSGGQYRSGKILYPYRRVNQIEKIRRRHIRLRLTRTLEMVSLRHM